jgi:stage II sporulation protein D
MTELENKFKQKINNINILGRFEDGRVTSLELVGDKIRRLSSQEFRMSLGWTRVKSTLIESIKFVGQNVEIKGRGFGHGVGLCQHGALGMAKEGKRFQEILSHYYPKTKLASIY